MDDPGGSIQFNPHCAVNALSLSIVRRSTKRYFRELNVEFWVLNSACFLKYATIPTFSVPTK